jgi:tRNA pseudouridine32 synthase/23S rRNA pseudouridine746 synthase
MNIVCETDHLLVVEKSSGWLTTPARQSDDPRPVLGRELQSRLARQIYPVHRLDFEVSGLTLWAKTPEAHRTAQGWFEHGHIGKLYEAWSRPSGTAPLAWAEWTSRLVRGKRRSFHAPHGKESRTRARVVAEGSRWRWELQPMTGRPHQLRVEMAHHGVPILGDTLYGGEAVGAADWIALRAVTLSFAEIPERLGLPERLTLAPLTAPIDIR